MPIVYQKWITRSDLRNNPDKVYVFGDNVARIGLGGQAKEMRGEPNAFGFPTKWRPLMSYDAFFNDSQPDARAEVSKAICYVGALVARYGKTVVVPSDGLGTGLSRLPEVAPQLYATIWRSFDSFGKDWGDGACPWVRPQNI